MVLFGRKTLEQITNLNETDVSHVFQRGAGNGLDRETDVQELTCNRGVGGQGGEKHGSRSDGEFQPPP